MPRRPHIALIVGALLVVALVWTADAYALSTAGADQTARPARWERPVAPVAPGARGPSRSSSSATTGQPPSAQPSPAPAASTSSPPAPAGSLTPGTVARHTGTDSVALTFDDGPGAQTPTILALLRQYHVRATFCLVGVHVRAHPDLVRAIVADGHTLCNHSWIHDEHLGLKPPEVIQADLQRTNDAIHAAVPGAPIRYYRQPGGIWTPAVISVAQSMGMQALGWSIDPWDWNVTAYPPGPVMTNHIIGNIESHVSPGAIVLSHDAGGDRTSTVAAYQTLLPYLLDQRHLSLIPMPVDTASASASGGPPADSPPPQPDPTSSDQARSADPGGGDIGHDRAQASLGLP